MSYICSAISVIIGSFIGHMLYDICKVHKSHMGRKREHGKSKK